MKRARMLLAFGIVVYELALDVVYNTVVEKVISEKERIVALHASYWDFQYKAIVESYWQ